MVSFDSWESYTRLVLKHKRNEELNKTGIDSLDQPCAVVFLSSLATRGPQDPLPLRFMKYKIQ